MKAGLQQRIQAPSSGLPLAYREALLLCDVEERGPGNRRAHGVPVARMAEYRGRASCLRGMLAEDGLRIDHELRSLAGQIRRLRGMELSSQRRRDFEGAPAAAARRAPLRPGAGNV